MWFRRFTCAALAVLTLVGTARSFQVAGFAQKSHNPLTVIGYGQSNNLPVHTDLLSTNFPRYQLTKAKSKNSEADEPIENEVGFWRDFTVNTPYALAYVFFLSFAFMRSVGEADGVSLKSVCKWYFASNASSRFCGVDVVGTYWILIRRQQELSFYF